MNAIEISASKKSVFFNLFGFVCSFCKFCLFNSLWWFLPIQFLVTSLIYLYHLLSFNLYSCCIIIRQRLTRAIYVRTVAKAGSLFDLSFH